MTAEKKKILRGSAKGSSKPRLNSILFAMMLEELMEGPTTWTELSEKTGLCRGTVLAAVRAMRDKKLVHIAGWERDAGGRINVPAFQLGRKGDTPKPVKSRSAINRDQRAKLAAPALRGTVFAGLGAMNDSSRRNVA